MTRQLHVGLLQDSCFKLFVQGSLTWSIVKSVVGHLRFPSGGMIHKPKLELSVHD